MPKNNPSSPRKAAFICVKNSLYAGWELQASLDKTLSNPNLSTVDKHLATELAYGYLRLKGRLEYILSHFLHSPQKIPRDTGLALGLAAYELLFLNRIPAYASVHYWVEHIKKGSGKLAKLANAVLRRIAENSLSFEDQDFYLQDSPSTMVFLSRYYSCPQWIIKLWLQSFSEQEVLTLLKTGLQAPPVGLRFNLQHPDYPSTFAYFAGLAECLLCQRPGLAFAKTPQEDLSNLLERGLLSRQSISSQKALLDLQPDLWPLPIWDACAGKGGKTGLLKEMGRETVWASDFSLTKLRTCKRELQRLGFRHNLLFSTDLCLELPVRPSPGTILLDAPCSGLGVLSRRPDSKWKRTPADCQQLAKVQARMLENAYTKLKQGGLLAYLTCTLNPAENRNQISEFLTRHPEARLKTEKPTPIADPWQEFFYTALIKKGG